jgi:hypothetical protein
MLLSRGGFQLRRVTFVMTCSVDGCAGLKIPLWPWACIFFGAAMRNNLRGLVSNFMCLERFVGHGIGP